MTEKQLLEEFVTWLTTQRNRNGSLYLENVARCYARYLQTAPPKLNLPLSESARNVYNCRTLEEVMLLCKTFRTAPNYKAVDYASSHNSFSAGLKCYKRYMEHLAVEGESQSKNCGDEIMEENAVAVTVHKPQSKMRIIDFSESRQYTNTRPAECVINGERIVAFSWASMYIKICEHLLRIKKVEITKLILKTKNGTTRRSFLMDSPLQGLHCKKLTNGKWINVNYSATDLVKMIGKISDACGIKKETIKLIYSGNEQDIESKPESATNTSENGVGASSVKPPVNIEIGAVLDTILSEKFANGFRYNSEIEIGRLRKFTNDLLGYEASVPDDNIVSYVKSKGTECEGKIYVVNTETKDKIKKLAEDYFDDGALAIFYEAFYIKHEHWLSEASVMSEEMLTNIFRSAFPEMKFTQTYFGRTDKRVYDVLKSEVLRVWGSDFLLSYDVLAERLTYIPVKRIEYVLGQNNDFIWNSKREFTCLSLIDITEEEKAAVCHFVEKEIEAHEYVSIADIPLGGISERNIELSLTAIHNAIFRSCLEGNYDRRGKIITHNGGSIDAKHIMDEYCRSLDRCTLDDLLSFEKELTGECHRWIPMQAGYDIMIRTAKNVFVAERHLSFDRNTIDNAIEHFMNGDEYIPLKTVTTFAPFPYCGQAWNLFLLESYCRRFSENFCFEVLSVNSSNAGAIVRKHSKMTYAEIMADAVAKSGVSLDERTVIEFLHKAGFIARRRYTQTAELIRQAKVLRG